MEVIGQPCLGLRDNLNYLLYKLNNNEHDAYDVLSDTFEIMITSVIHLKNQNNLSGWLISIARNLVRGHYKKLKRQQKILDYAKHNEPHYSSNIITELDKNYQYSLFMMAYEGFTSLHKKIFKLQYYKPKKNKTNSE
jgi:DNA-directed RNA polymerase specialized sigma24 family protein